MDAETLDEELMGQALALAEQAANAGEVPVGAVVAMGASVIGAGYNRSIGRHDPSAHAEIVALRDAGSRAENYRLPGSTLYVTLEPCLMCVGAAVAARVERLVFGAVDPKSGCLGGIFDVGELGFLNHRFAVTSGVCATQCGRVLREFFQVRR